MRARIVWPMSSHRAQWLFLPVGLLCIPSVQLAHTPGPVRWPNAISRTVEQARENLAESRLRLEAVREIRANAPAGTIVEQRPQPTTPAKADDAVNVAREEVPPIEVPKLIGLTEEEARKVLAESRLRLGKVKEKIRVDVAAGTIVEQRPQPPTPAKAGDAVDVTKATAPPIEAPDVIDQTKQEKVQNLDKPGKVLVPDVRNMSVQGARERLRERQLTLGRLEPERDDDREDVVVNQSPAGDMEVATGSAVDLWFAPRVSPPPPPPRRVYWILAGVVAALVFLAGMARARRRVVGRHRLRVEAIRDRGTSRVECDGEPIDVEVRLMAQRDPGRSQIEVSGPLVVRELRLVRPLHSSGREPQG